jgi:hypothetical protein
LSARAGEAATMPMPMATTRMRAMSMSPPLGFPV